MRRVFRSEWLKYRRTPTLWLLALAPVGFAAFPTWYVGAAGRLGSGLDLLAAIYQFWTAFWLPIGAALLAGLAATYEVKAGDWWSLRARPVRPALLYLGKLAVLWSHALLATFLLGALAALASWLLAVPGSLPWQAFALASLVTLVAALPLFAIQLWLATARGFAASLSLGIVGLLLAALIGGTSLGNGIWLAVPWAWPARLLGALLLRYAPATSGDGSTAPGFLAVALALGLVAVVAAASLCWFERREVT